MLPEIQRPNPVVNDIVIGWMSEHDLLEVVEIEEKSGLSRWGWAAYYAELQGMNRDLMLVARVNRPTLENERVAGYIVARAAAGELHINNVAVRAQYRRRGLGKSLMNCVVEQGIRRGATIAFLEVRAGNAAAQALYQTCGFQAIARRANYYSEPREDAVVMSLSFR
jgi:ribosomal-protein-alanine N-acetyltransferase